MILNELSMHGNALGREQMKQVLSRFLEVCHRISLEKGDQDFYYAEELFLNELVPGYTIHNWLKDPQVPKREQDFLRKMMNRRQLIDKKQFLESELCIDLKEGGRESATGCLAAYETGEYVVSLCTELQWKKESINGIYYTIEEGEQEVEVGNCSSLNHISQLLIEEKKKTIRMVSSGLELWEKRESIYPHLIFCECVRKQLEEDRNSLHIKMIMKRLQILEDYFENYQGKFNPKDVGYGCREESETVAKNIQLRGMRIFKTPEGLKEFFTYHISFAGNFPGRIHFIPDGAHKRGIIGYIGKHLPTGKFSTI